MTRTTYVLRLSEGDDIEDRLFRMPNFQRAAQGRVTLKIIGSEHSSDPIVGFQRLRDLRARGHLEVTMVSDDDYESELRERGLQRYLVSDLSTDELSTVTSALRKGVSECDPMFDSDRGPYVGAEELPSIEGPHPAESGPFAGLLSKAIDPMRLGGDEPPAASVLRNVRAWSVPSLEGTAFVASDQLDLRRALQCHLDDWIDSQVPDHLTAVRFMVPISGFGGPSVYLHVHTTATGPVDGGQQMFLELYGRVCHVGTFDLTTRDGANGLYEDRRARNPFDDKLVALQTPLPGPIAILITVATYSNVSYPGYKVGIYE